MVSEPFFELSHEPTSCRWDCQWQCKSTVRSSAAMQVASVSKSNANINFPIYNKNIFGIDNMIINLNNVLIFYQIFFHLLLICLVYNRKFSKSLKKNLWNRLALSKTVFHLRYRFFYFCSKLNFFIIKTFWTLCRCFEKIC